MSKVISCRNGEAPAETIEAAVFQSVEARYSQPARPAEEKPAESDNSEETQTLRQQIERLQNELTAAKREAFENGRREGEQRARAEISPMLERMNGSIAETVGVRAELRHRAERDVVQLAILIARRILHRELSVDPNALTALARVVFERMARAESCRITVHPSFAPALSAALGSGQTGRMHIEPDPDCAVGTLIIRSEEGLIDASVDSQLDEISRGLIDRIAPGAVQKAGTFK